DVRTQRSMGMRSGAAMTPRIVGLILASFTLSLAIGGSRNANALSAARFGGIRGRVELRHTPAPVERRPSVADFGTSSTNRGHVDDLLRSVVYLETAPRGAFERSDPGQAVMDQRHDTCVPTWL